MTKRHTLAALTTLWWLAGQVYAFTEDFGGPDDGFFSACESGQAFYVTGRGNGSFVIASYQEDGTINPDFGNNGTGWELLGNGQNGQGLDIQAGGGFLWALGQVNNNTYVAQLDKNTTNAT